MGGPPEGEENKDQQKDVSWQSVAIANPFSKSRNPNGNPLHQPGLARKNDEVPM